jgi:hypothetical protein
VRGIGFCVSVRHAEFMTAQFNARGIRSALFVSRFTPKQGFTRRPLKARR